MSGVDFFGSIPQSKMKIYDGTECTFPALDANNITLSGQDYQNRG